jgi:hypothetical protein
MLLWLLQVLLCGILCGGDESDETHSSTECFDTNFNMTLSRALTACAFENFPLQSSIVYRDSEGVTVVTRHFVLTHHMLSVYVPQ